MQRRAAGLQVARTEFFGARVALCCFVDLKEAVHVICADHDGWRRDGLRACQADGAGEHERGD
jgi:hypothetical protein